MQITWMKRKNRLLLTVGTSTHSVDKRFVVMHSSTDWLLQIRAVTLQDGGIYECQVYSTMYISMCNKRHPSLVRYCFTQLRHCNMYIIYSDVKQGQYFKFTATHHSDFYGTFFSMYITEENKTGEYFHDKRYVMAMPRSFNHAHC